MRKWLRRQTALLGAVLLMITLLPPASVSADNRDSYDVTFRIHGSGKVRLEYADQQEIVFEEGEKTLTLPAGNYVKMTAEQKEGRMVSVAVSTVDGIELEPRTAESTGTYIREITVTEIDKVVDITFGGGQMRMARAALQTSGANEKFPEKGDKFTGVCTVKSVIGGNGQTVHGVTLGEFTGILEGEGNADADCAQRSAAAPISGMKYGYTYTITSVNKSTGKVTGSLYMVSQIQPATGAVDSEGYLIGYQALAGVFSIQRQYTGKLQLKKTSMDTGMTKGNDCYSLKGAKYGVYSDPDCRTQVAILTTKEDGTTDAEELTSGKYYIKELSAPKGYALDSKKYTADVTAGSTEVVNVKDYPQSAAVRFLLEKEDARTGEKEAQGNAVFADAEFTVRYYKGLYDTDPAKQGITPARTWVMKTNESGKAALTDSFKISGDSFYKNSDGENVLPLGTVTIQETKAPKGYLLNREMFIRKITSEGTAENVSTYNAPVISENIISGELHIIKFGQDADDSCEQKTPLEGVAFEITSKTTGETFTITTDKNGYASTQQIEGGLVYDSYVVKEAVTPIGFEPVESFEVTISEENQILHYILEDKLIVAPVQLVKKDKTTGKTIPLANAEFQLLDSDKNPVTMTTYYPIKKVHDTFSTDGTGTFSLPEKLPAGIYYFREIKAPAGYLLNGQDIKFEITKAYDWNRPVSVACEDAPAMGKIRITKTGHEGGNAVPGAVFAIVAAEDIVTPDGTVRVSKGELVDTVTTGQDGKAMSKALYLGRYAVKETDAPEGYLLNAKDFETELKYKDQNTEIVYADIRVENEVAKGKIRIVKTDADTGKIIPEKAEFEIVAAEDIVTPGGAIKAKQGTVVDTVVSGENGRGVSGELHMGKYIVKEKCAPTGYLLNPEPREVELDYKDQNTRVVYGNVTIADMPARGKVVITKTDSESGTFLAGAEFAITAADDIITPDGTVRAEKGTVVDTVITNDEGKAYSKELFLGSYNVTEIKQPEGYVRSDQTWDVELLYEDQNTSVVTETVDAQNVPTRFVLTKKEAGSEEHLQGVKFEFWEKDGSEESEKEIVTTGEDGTLMIEKIMPGTYCIQEIETVPGYMLNETIYEFTVTDDGRIDGEETGFMTVENEKTKITCTKAVNAETGGQELLPKESRATDTVSMENLQSGTEYMLRGVLVDRETGKPLRENDSPSGAVLMSEYRFTATDSQMDVDMEFVFDAAAFAGRTIVVFEYLYQEDVEISRHADLEDLMQQLYVKDAEQQTGEKKEMDTPKETPQTGDEGSVLPIAAVAGAGTAAVLSVAMRVRYKKDCRENER